MKKHSVLLTVVVLTTLMIAHGLAADELQPPQQQQQQGKQPQANQQKQSNVETNPEKNPPNLPTQEQQPQQPSVIKRGNMNKLYYSPECQDDIKEHCPRSKKIELNDLSVLQCIYNEVQDLSLIDKECHHVSECECPSINGYYSS